MAEPRANTIQWLLDKFVQVIQDAGPLPMKYLALRHRVHDCTFIFPNWVDEERIQRVLLYGERQGVLRVDRPAKRKTDTWSVSVVKP